MNTRNVSVLKLRVIYRTRVSQEQAVQEGLTYLTDGVKSKTDLDRGEIYV